MNKYLLYYIWTVEVWRRVITYRYLSRGFDTWYYGPGTNYLITCGGTSIRDTEKYDAWQMGYFWYDFDMIRSTKSRAPRFSRYLLVLQKSDYGTRALEYCYSHKYTRAWHGNGTVNVRQVWHVWKLYICKPYLPSSSMMVTLVRLGSPRSTMLAGIGFFNITKNSLFL